GEGRGSKASNAFDANHRHIWISKPLLNLGDFLLPSLPMDETFSSISSLENTPLTTAIIFYCVCCCVQIRQSFRRDS
ncbi:hypothetical protein, partial [Microcystis sp.]|uniref:hypothetical protein n=1 Tax=Microcystis sp. TaxID=1127 RepID=UPI00391A2C44